MKPVCKICGEFHLGCEDWGCWKDAGAAGMIREAISKERAFTVPKEKKVNKVNLIVGAAFLVAIVASVLALAGVP